MIFYKYSENPAVENQAIDRSYRIGQQKNVIDVRLICPDTVEEKIVVMQQNKAKLAEDLIAEGDGFFRLFGKRGVGGVAEGCVAEVTIYARVTFFAISSPF